ncbi:hypothetical protein IMSAG025_01746 [Muribaculaceae bacterium]|nr:hypothetical protein IMSAG025_01746 [Muribaculaceae bacterium]
MASALSVRVGVAILIPSVAAIASAMESAFSNTFPFAGVTIMSGDKESSRPAITSLKPLKTERTQMIAAVAIAMPQIDTMDMAPTALCDFFDRR